MSTVQQSSFHNVHKQFILVREFLQVLYKKKKIKTQSPMLFLYFIF